MKHFKLIISVLLSLAAVLPANSQQVTDTAKYMDFLVFKVLDEQKQEAALVGWIKHLTYPDWEWGPQFPVTQVLTIPQSYVKDGKEYTMVEIGDKALYRLGFIGNTQRYTDFAPSRIILPPTIRRIGDYALNVHGGEEGLHVVDVDFPESVEYIGDCCLNFNQSGSVTFPPNLKYLGKHNISGIWMDKVTFLGNDFTITPQMVHPDCESIETLTISGENMTIDDSTFLSDRINTLELGKYPVTLRKGAFGSIADWDGNGGRVIVRCLEPYEIHSDAFSGETFGNATLYVPEASLEAYKTTKGWQKFAHIEPLPDQSKMVTENLTWTYYAKTYDEAMRLQRYNLRFSGTTTIDGKEYACAYRYTGKNFDPSELTPCAFIRQDGPRVYCRPNPEYDLADDPARLDIGGNLQADENGEILLYDFTNRTAMQAIYGSELTQRQAIRIQNVDRDAFNLSENRIVEMIGFDAADDGDLLSPMAHSGENGMAGLICVKENNTGAVIYGGSGENTYNSEQQFFDITNRDDREWTYFVHDTQPRSAYNPRQPFAGYYHIRLVKSGEHEAKAYRYQGEFDPGRLTHAATLRTDPTTGRVYCNPNPDYVLQDFDRLLTLGLSVTYNQFTGEMEDVTYAETLAWESFDQMEEQPDRNTSIQIIDGAYRRVCDNGRTLKYIEGLGPESNNRLGNRDITQDLIGRQWNSQTEGGLCFITDLEGNHVYEGHFADFYRNDLNKDGTVDVADINMLIEACVNPAALPDGINADTNRDGRVDVGDINHIINTMLGK